MSRIPENLLGGFTSVAWLAHNSEAKAYGLELTREAAIALGELVRGYRHHNPLSSERAEPPCCSPIGALLEQGPLVLHARPIGGISVEFGMGNVWP